jgi:hypothetical protein
MKINFSLFLLMWLFFQSFTTENKIIWQIGEADNSSAEFALSPNDYNNFIDSDFGWEDGYFLVGTSNPKTDWPYVLPGPSDQWGGTGNASGLRSHTLTVFFS